ncbi:uncharacterized protein LOC135808410 [Sycon ciliatum]|uniref:uncharacterized protein LOC135808410 n=1 Tax=Sycon ciliatum TaxID=27933 RepID=UPI0031F63976
MGAGASVRRKMEAEREHYDEQVKTVSEKLSKREEEHAAETNKLRTENASLKENIKQLRTDLVEERELWRQEREKTVSMMFGQLPLPLLEAATGQAARSKDTSTAVLLQNAPVLTKTYPTAVIACCNVVGFHRLVGNMSASEAVDLTDKLHILVDRAFQAPSMFVIERSADCCTVVSGICSATERDTNPAEQKPQTPIVTSSSSGGIANHRQQTPDFSLSSQVLPGAIEDDGADLSPRPRSEACTPAGVGSARRGNAALHQDAAVQCATSMAMSSLRLLESSVSVNIPGPKTEANHGQLQLRIALHSGSIHAGVVGVTQHSTGLPPDQLQHATPVPRLHVFGNTYSEALKLRDTSLALQIRVSQRFRELILASHSKFVLEQCPDFQSSTGGAASSALQHTYWLVGTEDTDVGLPPLDRAVSLGNYDDL